MNELQKFVKQLPGQIRAGFTAGWRQSSLYWRRTYRQHPLAVVVLTAGLIVSLLGLLTVMGLVVSIRFGAFGPMPTRDRLADITHYEASEVYAADSTLLGRYYFENRSNVRYREISQQFVAALLATEDARFFEHNGIDLRAWARVLFKSILLNDRTAGGGSTLTQQLAKNLFPREDYGAASLLINKLKEVIIAQRLEAIYNKEEILELYLNTVPFSENTFGIKVAAHRFFGTSPRELDPAQSAVLVAMLKAPTSYNPVSQPERSRQRRDLVLAQMARYGYLPRPVADSLQQRPLRLNYQPLSHHQGPAAYFRENLRLELKEMLRGLRKPNGLAYNLYTDGLKVYTTIDARIQEYAEKALRAHLKTLQKSFEDHLGDEPAWENDTILLLAKLQSPRYRNLVDRGFTTRQIDSIFDTPLEMTVFDWEQGRRKERLSPMDSIRYYLGLLNAGFLAMTPQTGEVKAWVGGIDHTFFQYDHVLSRRQVGSTFKPIVYTQAIRRGIHPCSYTPNALRTYWRYEGWQPRNADDQYGGLYSMEGGLIHSVNTVTVQMALRSGPAKVAGLAQRLGLAGEVPPVPAIALGAVEASLTEMVSVYGTFANRGVRPPLHYLRRVVAPDGTVLIDRTRQLAAVRPDSVLSVDQADMIREMLRSAVDRGTGRRLRFRYQLPNPIAGKTGTSQNHSDGWFLGFTPTLVAGAWVGAESPAVRFRSLRLGQGANTALPIFATFVERLNADPNFAELTQAEFPEPSQTVRDQLNCANIKWPEKETDAETATEATAMAPAPETDAASPGLEQ